MSAQKRQMRRLASEWRAVFAHALSGVDPHKYGRTHAEMRLGYAQLLERSPEQLVRLLDAQVPTVSVETDEAGREFQVTKQGRYRFGPQEPEARAAWHVQMLGPMRPPLELIALHTPDEIARLWREQAVGAADGSAGG